MSWDGWKDVFALGSDLFWNVYFVLNVEIGMAYGDLL